MLRWIVGSVAAAVVLLGAGDAAAGHKRHKADVDIESLKAELFDSGRGWEVVIRYKVEIEDACPGDEFDVIFELTECGRPLRDRNGRPVQVREQLDWPVEADDDEVKFDDTLSMPVPAGSFCDPGKLRVRAVVVRAEDGRRLDCKEKGVKFRGCRSVGRYDRHSYRELRIERWSRW